MKKPTKEMVLLLLAINCGFFVPQALKGDASTLPEAPSSSHQQTSLSWLGDAGKTYAHQAVKPPPAPGSGEDKADLQAVLDAQSKRTDSDIQEALADQKFTVELLAGVIGPGFTSNNYPVTFDFLNRVRGDVHSLNSTLKAEYKRPRPYQEHHEVKNLFPSDAYSYPGDKASESRMLMLVLTELFPDKGVALLNRDKLIAQSDVNAGVDYPSDIIAGRALAHALMFVLQDNPAFDQDMAKARDEIASKTTSTAASIPK